MKDLLIVFVVTFGLVGLWGASGFMPAQAQSAETNATKQMATFAIDNMTCALCPVTVRNAMQGVSGVQSVSVDFEQKTATVVFDPAVTDTTAIAAAATDAGYPAAVAGS